jgi:23S rRNA (guanosine2251-2'-O)-methyltransferase
VNKDRTADKEKKSSEMIHGVNPVLEALKAGSRTISRISISEGAQNPRLRELIELARSANIPVHRLSRKEIDRLAMSTSHQGVIAAIASASYTDAVDLVERMSQRVGTNDPPIAVVLDGVEDPRNLGAIVRTVECVGAHGIFLPERRAVGLTETVAKSAAGALEHVPVARVVNTSRLLEELKGAGLWVAGIEADGKRLYTDWDWSEPTAIVLGSEGSGIHRLVREKCDVLLSIPMRGKISSLNVSVAAAIVLYEVVRQRAIKGKWTSDGTS